MDLPEARAALRGALDDADENVRHAAAYAAGLWRDAGARGALLPMLRAGSPALRRIAAEALGRIGGDGVVPSLLAAAEGAEDRTLDHSVTYALIESGATAALAAGLRDATSPRSRRAALLALEQTDAGRVAAADVLPLLRAADPALNAAAWWIAGRHPEWGAALSEHLSGRLAGKDLTSDQEADLQRRLSELASLPSIQALLADMAAPASHARARMVAIRAMGAALAAGGAAFRAVPASWEGALTAALDGPDADLIAAAVAAARAAPARRADGSPLDRALLSVSGAAHLPLDVRLQALSAVLRTGAAPTEAQFHLLLSGLAQGQPAPTRAAAAATVERARLDDSQLVALTDALRHAGALELPRLVRPFESARGERVGQALLDALEAAPARASVRPDLLIASLANFPPAVRARGEALMADVHRDAQRQAEHLASLLASLPPGEVRRGQAVFNSGRAACLACHTIGYVGGRTGPDLTRIGEVRTERDLLEAILYPSASFVRSYEPVVVSLRSGATHAGVLRADRPDAIVLVTASDEEVRIPRQEVAGMTPGTVSLMPPGLADALTRQELADLLAFLKATRWGAD
jgi:putative heme-binding domain-containing protein